MKADFPLTIICSLGVALGGALLWAWQADGRAAAAASEIKALKDSNRSAWQKVYDAQENTDDKVSAAEGEASLWKWKYEQLEKDTQTCREGKK